MKSYLILVPAWLAYNFAQAQVKPIVAPGAPVAVQPLQTPPWLDLSQVTDAPVREAIAPAPLPFSKPQQPEIFRDDKSGLPILIRGKAGKNDLVSGRSSALENRAFSYLEFFKSELQLPQVQESFSLREVKEDAQGWSHIRLQQIYKGVEVYGAEIWLHAKDGEIGMLNGRYRPIPGIRNLQPALSKAQAVERAFSDIRQREKVKDLTPEQRQWVGEPVAAARLVIYTPPGTTSEERLCWYMELVPNLLSRWAYFVDAQSGEIITKYSLLCRLGHDHTSHKGANPVGKPIEPGKTEASRAPFADGPATAQANDLLGISRKINTWLAGSNYFLIDASRKMFSPTRSQLPGNPVGAIWTINANNQPADDNLSLFQITSANNAWNNPTAVSAHYNAGRAFEYYESTFGRNSINGSGGNIISIINIVDDDGSGLDNAFWSGAAMFYGNGNQGFLPLARGLDVAAHEMTHGVIQSTANLEYFDESGALNESFADVFGALVDREDFKIGEDVVRTASFPSGALRDMANPNNGGTRYGDRGWQPAHTSQQYRGQDDNGGVHVNSGIPNRAFYLFATAVGKDKAEKVYYDVLSNYLTRSSNFVDCRLAVIEAARKQYGESAATAAAQAFDQVGITGSTGAPKPTDYAVNPGAQYILTVDADSTGLFIYDLDGQEVASLQTTEKVLSRPSISDNGSTILYVNGNRNLRLLQLDWAKGTYTGALLSSQPVWRNAAISKDGLKMAALTTDYQPRIYVVDLRAPNQGKYFPLYNPTFTQGIQSGEVQYADAIEWDLSGNFVLYDALNEISLTGSFPYHYWDIGILRAWNSPLKTFGDGNIEKLFTGLVEGENLGNPTFSKNTPDIIAFDYIIDADGDDRITGADDFYGLGVNVETGDLGQVYENTFLGYPNYSVEDDYVLFNSENLFGTPQVRFVPLAKNKIAAGGQGGVFLSNRIWGTWFAVGSRILTANEEPAEWQKQLRLFPNPFTDELTLELDWTEAIPAQIEVTDLLGRTLYRQQLSLATGTNLISLPLGGLAPGAYALRIQAGGHAISRKIIRF